MKHLPLFLIMLISTSCHVNFEGGKLADPGNVTEIGTPENLGRVTTFAGTAQVPGTADGNGAAAQFSMPFGITTDRAGNVFVADYMNHSIRKITPAGDVSTFAGTPGIPGSVDANGTSASFYMPAAIAIDSSDNLYVADVMNHTVRKITPTGGVTTIAGTVGVSGYADGTGTAASFNLPAGIGVDSTGHIYVSDLGNALIRKITPAGVVTTFSGIPGSPGATDGDALTGQLTSPYGLTVDKNGNVFVVEFNNHIVRKITPTGVISTVAGDVGVMGDTDGIGTAATFKNPAGISVDNSGNLYVADYMNHRIRKITAAGVVTTVAGSAQTGSADGTGAAAEFFGPAGITIVKSTGVLYVSDTGNGTIRKIR